MDSIPPSAAPFFQEYRFSELDPSRDQALVIERILAFGNRAEVRWLLQNYGWVAVKDWVRMAGEKRLPGRRYRLWCVLFDLQSRETTKKVWPY